MVREAGVLFNTAETEQGASPTRSATVFRLTLLCVCRFMVSPIANDYSASAGKMAGAAVAEHENPDRGFRTHPGAGSKRGAMLAATLQVERNQSKYKPLSSPIQKSHVEDLRRRSSCQVGIGFDSREAIRAHTQRQSSAIFCTELALPIRGHSTLTGRPFTCIISEPDSGFWVRLTISPRC